MLLLIIGCIVLSLLTMVCIYDCYKSQRIYNTMKRINIEMEKKLESIYK